MRRLILPLLIFLLINSIKTHAQTGLTCATAYTLPMDGNCYNYNMSTTLGNYATGTTCNYTNNRRVTWFKFSPATYIMAASFNINLDVSAQMQVTFYDPGATGCGLNVNAPLATLCSATGGGTLMPPATTLLIPGRTYYIRLYANLNDALTHPINICATPVTKQPITVNGSCGNFPIDPLGVGSNYSPLPTGVTNRCGYTNDKSVTWFQFTPSATLNCASFNINVDNGARTEIALYNQAGVYQPNSTLCLPDGSGIWAPALPFTFTSGNTYYLRIYTEILDGAAHNINICAQPFIQPNDLCSSATRLDNTGIQDNNVCATGSVANGGNEPAWITSNSMTLLCAAALQNTAWYYFIVNDNTIATTVSVSSINCDNYGGGGIGAGAAGIQLGLLQGPSTLTNCVSTNALFIPPNTPTHCYQSNSTSFGFTVPPNASIPNGTKMYIAVDGYSGANCSYIISTGNAIPIPVKLRYFTVWKQAQSNQVRWITSWETDNKNFEIERSTDGTNFSLIGKVDGAVNSTTDVQYKFDDKNPPLLAYYRLKQVDIDGKFEYSNVIMIKRDNIKSIFNVAFANPVHNNSVITINTEKPGIAMVRVVDVAGRELSTESVSCGPGNNTLLKDFSRLASGNYYLIVSQYDNRIVKPFIKQ